MTLNDHAFVREAPPPDASAFCPDCREPWEFCACELPEYRGAFIETQEGATNGYRC